MLKAENLTKKYGSLTVLDGFSHNFTEGSFTAIMGPSGCGKTTLLSILMGLLTPDGGSVTRDSGRLSAVFQEDRLCENLSVLSNLRLVQEKKMKRPELTAELEAVGLYDCADKPVRELSGGMKRRAALLRALLADYDILFLDEPFKGLDSGTKNKVMSCTRSKTEGKTVILVTHDSEEADFFGAETLLLSRA